MFSSISSAARTRHGVGFFLCRLMALLSMDGLAHMAPFPWSTSLVTWNTPLSP